MDNSDPNDGWLLPPTHGTDPTHGTYPTDGTDLTDGSPH